MSNPYDNLIPETQGDLATGAPSAAPAAAPAGPNPYDSIIPDVQGARLRASLTQGVQANPATVATQRQDAATLGVPPAAVEALPELAQQAQVQRIDQATQGAPVTRDALTNIDFAKVAHPDADRLAQIERTLKYVFGATYNTDGSSLAGDLWKNTVAALSAGAKPALLGASLLPQLGDMITGAVAGRPISSAQDAYFRYLVAPLDKNIDAAQLPTDAPFVRKAVGTVGQLVGMLAQMFATQGGNIPQATEQALTPISEAISHQIAHGIKGMAMPALGDALQTGQKVYEATGNPLDAVRAAVTQYGVSTAGGIMPMSAPGSLLARLGWGAVSGATQSEVSREAMNLVLPETMRQDFNPEDDVLAGIIGMGLAGVHGPRAEPNLYPAIRQTYIDAARAEAAAKSAQAVDVLSKLAAESKLREHDAGAFHQLVAKMAEDPDALKAVYAKGGDVDAVMQQHGVTDADLMQTMPQVAKGLQEARATGGDVRIPIEDYATHIAGSPLDEGLRPNLRVDPEGMTVKESEDYYQSQVEQFQRTAETTIAGKSDELQRQAEADEIRDTVQQQLQEAGRTQAAAKVEAELARAFFATMSERAGMSPKELFDKSGFSVQGGQSPARPGGVLDQARTVQVDGELRPTEDANGRLLGSNFEQQANFWRWAGATQAVDETGRPLMVFHGTRGDFDTFDRDHAGKTTGAGNAKLGFFFTDRPDIAGRYSRMGSDQQGAQSIVPTYLAMKNPVRLKAANMREADKLLETDLRAKHDGAIISVGEGESAQTVYMVRNPEQVKSAIGNDGTFDVHDASLLSQASRGTFNPETSTVRLLREADLSTFTHEFGHFALETLNRLAPNSEALAADRDAIFKWLGVKDAAAWQAMSLDEKRPFHEQFARGFEAYLMEGKAPAQSLQGVFGRIRAWMLSVYQSLKNLNVQLTPEVRQVFDRLLASEDAIREAQQTRGYFGLEKLPDGTDPKEAAAYRALGQDATQEAISELGARSVRDMRWMSNAKNSALRKLQGEAKAARKAAREEATRQVDESPEMKAKAALAQLEAAHENNPLSADMNAQLVAEAHGFQTVDQMHRSIEQFGDRDAAIDHLTDLLMLHEHGELTDPTAIELAAEAAIHNDARARFMATGLKILTKSLVPAKQLAQAAKEAAERIVASKTIASLRPEEYSAAEARANREMLKTAPKDPAAAVQAQRSALLNNRLYKTARDALDEVKKSLEYLGKFDKDTVRQKIDLDVRDQIDELLDRFDLRKTPPNDERLTREQQNLQQWLEAQRAAGYQPSVSAEAADSRVRMAYRDLTVEQFRGLVDSVKAMEQVGRERQSITVDGRKQELNAFVEGELVPKLKERGQNFTAEQLLEKPELREGSILRQALDHFNSYLRAVGAQLKPIEFKRNEYDRHEILGPFGKAIFEPIMRANYRKVDMLRGLSDDFGTMAKKLGKPWQESLHQPVRNDVLMDPDLGRPLTFTRGRMLGMALHVGNESNFDKLARGWGWQPEAIMKFLKDNMTTNDWHAVQSVWDLYEKHWPETEAMYRRLGQTIPEKIPARGFTITTSDGQLLKVRGGYAAITYDPLRSRRGEKQASGESIDPSAGLFGRDYFSRNTPTNGSMNARVAGYTDRVSLDYGDVARKLRESIHDLAYREALIDAHKIIEHAGFRKAFREAYGREAYRSLQDWLGRLANSNNMDRSVGALGKFLQYTRTGMVINAIAFRATTVLKHGGSAGIKTLGWFAGGGEKYLASRMAAMGHDYTNQIEGAREKFPEIRARLMQQDRDFRATSHALFEKDSKLAQAERFGHAAVAWSDMMTAVPTAWAAYDRAITEGIPKSQGGTGQPMTEDEAVAYANKVVREAHGTNIESGRSMVLNTDSEALKMFTTLYGFMNNTYGQMADGWDKLHTAGISNTPVLARTFMAMIIPALWAGYLKGGPKDDKGEGWGHWMAAAIAEEVAATVPFVRDATAMVEGYKNAGMVSAENWVSTMVSALKDVYKAATDPDRKGSIVRDVANAVGMGLHIPGAGQAGTSLQYLENVREGKEQPQSAAEVAKGIVTGHGSR